MDVVVKYYVLDWVDEGLRIVRMMGKLREDIVCILLYVGDYGCFVWFWVNFCWIFEEEVG